MKKGLIGRSTLLRNRWNRKPVSVLSCHLSSQPTPRQRAGSSFSQSRTLALSVYLALLVLVPSPPYVAIQRRELLPRGFILTLSGGLFSVTAFIRLLPSVLSTAGCPFQSGLSSESWIQRQVIPPIFQRSIYIRACAQSCHSVRSFLLLPSSGQELCLRISCGTALTLNTFCRYRNCCARIRCSDFH